ncbi:hypothetical protein [Enterococcus faecalis]|uniref:hypothetical protein n=1 Tax=Enterococcus faecalis TaxID=1351 RepID=UPI0030C8543C
MNLEKLRNLLLSKKQLKNIDVFCDLYPPGKQMIEIEKRHHISKKELKRTIKKLNEEIRECKCFAKSDELILIKDGFITFTSDINYKIILTQLRKKYLQDSTIYKSLLFVLEQRCFHLYELSDYLFYSDSYTYKVIKQLKDFFNYLETDLKLIKGSESKFFIEGNESSKIILHYLLVMLIPAEKKWVFKNIKKETIKSCQQQKMLNRLKLLMPCNEEKILNILAIYIITLQKSNGIYLDQNIIEVGKVINNKCEFTLSINKMKELISIDIEIHFLFILHYFIPELLSKEQKIIIGKEYTKIKKNEIIQDCIKFLDSVKQYFSIPEDNYHELLYTLCERLIVIHYMDLHYFVPENMMTDYNHVEEKYIDTLFDIYFFRYANEQSYSKLKYSLVSLIARDIKLTVKEPLKIYIGLQHYSEYRMIVVNILEYKYNKKFLEIVENYDEADILISDVPFIFKPQKNFFLLKNVLDPYNWFFIENIDKFFNNILNNE